jgi:hypothetical protein
VKPANWMNARLALNVFDAVFAPTSFVLTPTAI